MKLAEKTSLISLEHVTKKYKNKIVIKDFNLDIKPGERIGLIGSNGSGKSTISEIIGGIRKPTTGKIIKEPKIVVGFQFQESHYPNGITVMDMIQYYLQAFKINLTINELNQLLATYQILHLTNKMISNLSGGQQQRLNILLSLIHKPDLVILDEVSTGLDIEVKEEIFEFLQTNIVKKNIAMILVSHNMSEIEHFCERIIYMHEGQIIEDTTVKNVINKYGSVDNYIHWQFNKHKKSEQTTAIVDQKKHQKFQKKHEKTATRINMNKQEPLIQLLIKYYLRGFFVPFFLIVYPILILFLEGFAIKALGIASLKQLIGGIAIMQVISIGIFIIPQTIIEFKNSVLMKRIGSTNIHPLSFVLATIIMGIIFAIIAFLWTLLWAGIFFGQEFTWREVALPQQIALALPWIMIVFASAIALGMMIASFLKTETSYIVIANIIYLPIAFLSGAFFPISFIEQSDILKYVTYASPFKYCVSPWLDAWTGTFTFTKTIGWYLTLDIGLLSTYIGIATWKLKWQQ